MRTNPATSVTRIDFGDNCEHTLIVSDLRTSEAGNAYSRYIGGERDCPPDDCGGTLDFYVMLIARTGRKHPDHAEICQWVEG